MRPTMPPQRITRRTQQANGQANNDAPANDGSIEIGRRSEDSDRRTSTSHRESLTTPATRACTIKRPEIKQPRCEQFTTALKNSGWAQTGTFHSPEEAESFIKTLKSHLESKCSCVSKPSVQLLVGIAYLELFLFRLKDFGVRVDDEEDKVKTTLPESDEDDMEDPVPGKDGHQPSTNKPEEKQTSKFDSLIFPHLTNWHSLESLLIYLKNAVDHWYNAIKSGENSIEPSLIQKLRLPYNLATAFYACSCYKMVDYQWKVCRVYMLIHKSKLNSLQPTNSIQALYFLARTYLDYGLLQHAIHTISKADDLCRDSVNSDCFEARQVQLLKIEIDIWLGKQEAAQQLKAFIDSEYLQKLTLNRYLLKIQAFLLANKFYGFEYEYQTNLKEFIEPLQMSVSVLKRWFKPCFSEKSGKGESTDKTLNAENDPMWYRFAWIECGFKAMLMTGEFQLNIGMPHDLVYPFNGMIKIARQLSNIYWLNKLLVLGSRFDQICDKHGPCQLKLKNASDLLFYQQDLKSAHQAYVSDEISTMMGSIRINDQDLTQPSINHGDFTISFIDSPRQMSRYEPKDAECGHGQNTRFYDLKKRFQKVTSLDESYHNDHFLDHASGSSGSPMVCKFNISHPFAEFLALEVSLYKVAFSSMKDKALQLLDLSKLFTEALKRMIEKLMQTFSVQKIQASYGPLTTLNFFIHLHLVRALYSSKNYLQILSLCEPFIFSDDKFDRFVRVFEFEQRTALVFLIAYYVGAKYSLDTSQEKGLWTEVNVKNCETSGTLTDNDADQVPVSTPPRMPRTAPSVIKAPKGGTKYKMSPLHDYVAALGKELDKDGRKRKGTKGLFDNYSDSPDEPNGRTDNEAYDTILKMDAMRKGTFPQAKSEKKTAAHNQSKSLPKAASSSSSSSSDAKNFGAKASNPASGDNPASSIKSSPPMDFSKLKVFLLTALKMTNGHPPFQFYRLVLHLLWKIDSNRDRNSSAFYFSEFLSNPSFRYRCHQVSGRKGSMISQWGLDLEPLKFDYRSFREDPLKKLLCLAPHDWRIVQIYPDIRSNIPDLYVCRYQNGKQPVTMKIRGDSGKFTQDFMKELDEIIQLSNASIVNRDSKTFWKVRYALDDRLSLLLKSVEMAWFGPFRGIFLGSVSFEGFETACKAVRKKILYEADRLKCKIPNTPLLEVLIESAPLLEASEFMTGLRALVEGEVESNFFKSCHKIWIREIEKICPMDDKSIIYSDSSLSPVGLVLDKHILGFPFEALPFLTKIRQPFFRIPSLNYLSAALRAKKTDCILNQGADENNAFYVLNPADNLAKTEEFFKESMNSKENWSGVIGKAPDPSELRDALQQKDIYIFFGHGAGSPYYRKIPETVDCLCLKAASIVIGCCSAKLPCDGEQLEPWGVSSRFLVNGAPAYMGILWDVTDKDIDRFSDRFLECWLSEWRDKKNPKPSDMLNAVAQSRDACRLKNLIGASAVVYGLPISTRKMS